jgi:hypothetical protein
MKETDMELKAVLKERLQSLEADSSGVDQSLLQPWSSESISGSTRAQQARMQQTSAQRINAQQTSAQQTQRQNADDLDLSYWDSDSCPQAIALEVLQQRSRSNDRSGHMAAHADNLVAQEIYRLEIQANNINERSQQQAAELLAMKRSAQQATVALRRHGIHDHPQLSAIAQLFESSPAAKVPHIERNAQGQFALSHRDIDFHRAEQEAVHTANELRNRQPHRSSVPFAHPIQPGPAAAFAKGAAAEGRARVSGHSDDSYSDQPYSAERFSANRSPNRSPSAQLAAQPAQTSQEPSASFHWITTLVQAIAESSKGLPGAVNLFERVPVNKEQANRVLGAQVSIDSAEQRSRQIGSEQLVPFSWPEVAIWFGGAAIARLIIGIAVIHYPFIQTPLLISLVGAILFGLYQVVFAKLPNFGMAYRLVAAMLGLFLGSLF